MRSNGLGKGLDSLIPQTKRKDNTEKKDINNNINKKNDDKKEEKIEIIKEVIKEVPTEIKIKLNQIEPNVNQPRKKFDEDSLMELAESIKQVGLIQPIIVSKNKTNDNYTIIAGERRWRACKIANIKDVPVIIKDYTEKDVMEIALIENIQRENLNPIEEAYAYKSLIEEYNIIQDELAQRISKSRVTITNSMRLLKLDKRVQQMLIDDMISQGHARALISIEDKEIQYHLALKVFDEKLSVREIERLVKNSVRNTKKNRVIEEKTLLYIKEITSKMASAVGSKVNINSKSNGRGKIEIEYYSQEELERIYEYMMERK